MEQRGRGRPRRPNAGRRDRRLTDSEVLAIRDSSEPYRILAERYGCSSVEICHIRKFKHYRRPLNLPDWGSGEKPPRS